MAPAGRGRGGVNPCTQRVGDLSKSATGEWPSAMARYGKEFLLGKNGVVRRAF